MPIRRRRRPTFPAQLRDTHPVSYTHLDVYKRQVLLTTAGATPLPAFAFESDDVLLLGAESSGVPPHVHDAADARVAIPMRENFRSLNVAVAAGIALAEELRQTKGFPA